jgi:hypothetical protein
MAQKKLKGLVLGKEKMNIHLPQNLRSNLAV